MHKKEVEKRLREKANILPEAEFSLKTVEDKSWNIPLRRKRIRRTPVLVAAAVLLSFTVILTANAEVRNSIISFFQAEVIEEVPADHAATSKESIRFIGKQNIENIADVEYYEFDSSYHLMGDYVVLENKDGELQYYQLENGQAKEVAIKSTKVQEKILFRGDEYPLNEEYAKVGDQYFHRSIATKEGDWETVDGVECSAEIDSVLDNKTAWLSLYVRQFSAYPILYDLGSGEVTDVLAGFVDANLRINTIQHSPDNTKLILEAITDVPNGAYYYFDTVTNTFLSVVEATGIKNIYTCGFLDNNTLELTQQDLDAESVTIGGDSYAKTDRYHFTVSTGELKKLPQNDGAEVCRVYNGSIIKGNEYYCLHTDEGKSYTIENLDIYAEYLFLANPSQKKVLIANTSESYRNSLNVTELGVLDLERMELKSFERNDSNFEGGISWRSDDTIAIQAVKGMYEGAYLYLYKLK